MNPIIVVCRKEILYLEVGWGRGNNNGDVDGDDDGYGGDGGNDEDDGDDAIAGILLNTLKACFVSSTLQTWMTAETTITPCYR